MIFKNCLTLFKKSNQIMKIKMNSPIGSITRRCMDVKTFCKKESQKLKGLFWKYFPRILSKVPKALKMQLFLLL